MANIELHVHPFLGKNSLIDVVKAMNETNLDILALEALDAHLFPLVTVEAKMIYPKAGCDNSGIKLPNGKYLLNAGEYNTQEDLHVLTVGYSQKKNQPQTEIKKLIDTGLENKALVILDHPFIDNTNTRTAGHISEELEHKLEELCKEYSGQIALEWNGYCIPWMRRALKSGLNLTGFDLKYHDVNKKAEELSEKLRKEGYNVPIIADTDLHARTKRYLKHMGTARFKTNVEGETATEIVASIKKNIFQGNYQNVKRYVSSAHLLEAFCLPILLPKYFEKPRA